MPRMGSEGLKGHMDVKWYLIYGSVLWGVYIEKKGKDGLLGSLEMPAWEAAVSSGTFFPGFCLSFTLWLR